LDPISSSISDDRCIMAFLLYNLNYTYITSGVVVCEMSSTIDEIQGGVGKHMRQSLPKIDAHKAVS
jgi:hypothetical protein